MQSSLCARLAAEGGQSTKVALKIDIVFDKYLAHQFFFFLGIVAVNIYHLVYFEIFGLVK